ncbi:hypothetical protein B0H10DRAFT_2046953 [Mycena sp. CBHHK59/15]|nr:hypothetical protein B0H10DRAFT_2046953 [Mycena sp. CBHHK59/15]
MEDSPETGDLAQVAEGRFRVFDQTGEWVPVVAGAMHPYPPLRKYIFRGDDSGWISPRTYQIDQKTWRENSKTPSRPNKKLKTKIPEIAMLRQNEWLGDLTKTWGGSPFIYIKPVAAPILQVLQNLSARSIPIPTIPIFDIKHGSVANPPSTAAVFEDFHVLYDNIINYTDLCAGSSVAKDSTSKVLAMLMTSTPTTEWRPGHRMVGVFDLTATDYGLRRCRLDCEAMVAENVGEGRSAFRTYNTHIEPEELAQFFPPPPIDPGKLSANALVKEIRKRHASQAKHLETVGESPWMSSCICPQGWFSDVHVDSAGASQLITHFEGHKLWLVWTPNEHNLSWWGIRHPHPSSGSPDLTITEALEHLTDLQLIHVTGPCAFILPPFSLHSVISFSFSSHAGAQFVHESHWPDAKRGLEFCKDLIMGPLFPVEKKLELLRVVDDDCKLWKIAMGNNSDVSNYFEEWATATGPVLAELSQKTVSTA